MGNLAWRSMAAVLALTVIVSLQSSAEMRLPTIFGDHMVFQRDEPVPVWGWDEPGQKVSVTIGDATVAAPANPDGRWRVDMPAMAAGGPVTMLVSGSTDERFADILIGEVWFCSGQSNMEFTVQSAINFDQEKAAATHPLIRHITVPKQPSGLPLDDVNDSNWQVCSPETVGGFTAAGYFFGRHLQEELNVPIGLINSSWGGTLIEPWIPLAGYEQVPALESILARVRMTLPETPEHKERLAAQLAAVETWLAEARTALTNETPVPPRAGFPAELLPMTSHQDPTTLYNGMVRGVVPYGIRGAIWYQGESNHGDGMLYVEKTKALVGGWRTVWSKPDMPFYFVQIAPYTYGAEDPEVLPRFWEAQSAAATLPGLGMAVIHDVGNINDIHPRNKQAVGKRLALIALAKTYGQTDLVYSGPTFREMNLEGNRIRLRFDHVGGGLVSRDGKPLDTFEIYDADGEDFVAADAVVDGQDILLSAAAAPKPVCARFAWNKVAEPNLMNKEGLPAAPFRCGEIPVIDYLARNVPEAADYTLVYDLDLKRLGSTVSYTIDNSGDITAPFDRVAYFLELRRANEKTKYVYTSMDAFTDDPSKLGIPTVASNAHFQTKIADLTVVSNAEGITTGTGLAGGNIEFWPNNYSKENSAAIPGASETIWDFGDVPVDPVQGYGCMQVHNAEAKQTVFAINCWNRGANADLGIGNSPQEPVIPGGDANVANTRDWTFQANAGQYQTRRLRVLVRLKK